jgi:hypothetical protein
MPKGSHVVRRSGSTGCVVSLPQASQGRHTRLISRRFQAIRKPASCCLVLERSPELSERALPLPRLRTEQHAKRQAPEQPLAADQRLPIDVADCYDLL